MVPTAKNKRALILACRFKCKNLKLLRPKPNLVIIRPSCESVENATTFLISHSSQALRPDTKVVSVPMYTIRGILKGRKRYNKNTPAVTRVDECTSAETGVGAAIAAGNQAEKGSCADFVIAITTRNNNEIETTSAPNPQYPKRMKNKASPNRFLNPVKRPPPKDPRLENQITRKNEVNPSRSQKRKNINKLAEITRPTMDKIKAKRQQKKREKTGTESI